MRSETAKPSNPGPDSRANRRDEVVGRNRLRDMRVEARGQRLGAIVQPRIRGDRNGGDSPAMIGRPRANVSEQLIAVDARQSEVGDQDMRRTGIELTEGVGCAGNRPDGCAGVLERLAKEIPRVLLVVDDEDVQIVQSTGGGAGCRCRVRVRWRGQG